MAAKHQKLTGAMAVLAEVMGYYKHAATEFEANLWQGLVDDLGDEAVTSYLLSHIKRSPFSPKVNEVIDALRPGYMSEQAAMEELLRAVARFGPYTAPTFQDPALVETVHLLGGWVVVNEQVPSAEARWDYEAYLKRFVPAYKTACANLALRRGAAPFLRGLHDLSIKPLALSGPTHGEQCAAVAGAPVARIAQERQRS